MLLSVCAHPKPAQKAFSLRIIDAKVELRGCVWIRCCVLLLSSLHSLINLRSFDSSTKRSTVRHPPTHTLDPSMLRCCRRRPLLSNFRATLSTASQSPPVGGTGEVVQAPLPPVQIKSDIDNVWHRDDHYKRE